MANIIESNGSIGAANARLTAPVIESIDKYKLITEFYPKQGYVVHMVAQTVVQTPPAAANTVGAETSITWTEVKRIGGGGFGSVGLEKGVVGGKETLRAVKRLSRDFYRNVKVDFTREVLALVAVKDQKEFVRFLGWYEDRSFVYIAMEYVMYGDLGEYLKEHGPTPETESKEIIRQLLKAIKILHEKEICHRDLKPPNVLIASLQPIRIKLADFGASKTTTGTRLKTVCGTQGYFAPEVQGLLPKNLRLGKNHTIALDMWAVGSILHVMVTLETPFTEDPDDNVSTASCDTTSDIQTTDMVQFLKFCYGDIEFPTEKLVESKLSREGIDFITKLLVADPRLRMTAAESLNHNWLVDLALLERQAKLERQRFEAEALKKIVDAQIKRYRNQVEADRAEKIRLRKLEEQRRKEARRMRKEEGRKREEEGQKRKEEERRQEAQRIEAIERERSKNETPLGFENIEELQRTAGWEAMTEEERIIQAEVQRRREAERRELERAELEKQAAELQRRIAEIAEEKEARRARRRARRSDKEHEEREARRKAERSKERETERERARREEVEYVRKNAGLDTVEKKKKTKKRYSTFDPLPTDPIPGFIERTWVVPFGIPMLIETPPTPPPGIPRFPHRLHCEGSYFPQGFENTDPSFKFTPADISVVPHDGTCQVSGDVLETS